MSLDMSTWHREFISRPHQLGLSIFIAPSFGVSHVKRACVLFPLWLWDE